MGNFSSATNYETAHYFPAFKLRSLLESLAGSIPARGIDSPYAKSYAVYEDLRVACDCNIGHQHVPCIARPDPFIRTIQSGESTLISSFEYKLRCF